MASLRNILCAMQPYRLQYAITLLCFKQEHRIAQPIALRHNIKVNTEIANNINKLTKKEERVKRP